jgi:HTH-type transcriptional regulator, competence development regulator
MSSTVSTLDTSSVEALNSGTPENTGGAVALTLGQYLSSIRLDRKMSLRQVEEATNKEVSNAYISQLENGRVTNPSPNILHTLADIYAVDYIALMQLAGYLPAADKRSDQARHGRVATFAEHNLTKDEEVELLDYLQFLRTKRKP